MLKTKVIFSFAILTIVLLFLFYYQIYFPGNSFCREEIIFSVSKGDGFKEIGKNLKEKEIIKSDFYFQIYSLLSGKFRNFQAGSYYFCFNESVVDIANAMYRGRTAQKKLTIIEGWNLEDVADYFENIRIIDRGIFLEKAKVSEFVNSFSFLKNKSLNISLEGFLFPDTYFIPYDADIDLVIETVLSNFNVKLNDDLKKEIENQEKSIFEIITIASLIEKEVRTFEDKKIVSGIIQKRLEIGMPLQIDATISYITGKRTVRISIAETQIDSPYNTYKYRGLPIGPICNPGLESIEAAIFPEETEYLFYLSKPDGETVFSRNLNEHNVAKNKYLRNNSNN